MNHTTQIKLANRLLLGLLFFIPGLLKLFVMGPSVVSSMMSGIVLFSWAPMFWAWVLIISEIVFGLALIANWKVEYAVWPLILIMVVAAFTVNWGNWSGFIMHIAIASNLLMYGCGCENCLIREQKMSSPAKPAQKRK